MNKGLINIATVYTPLLLIINLGLGSQQEPITIAGVAINQIINWIVILGTAIVVKNAFSQSVWPLILIVGVIFTKLATLALGDITPLYIGYKIFLLTLTMLGGIVYINRHLDLVYKQVLILCFFNVIMMILQTSNAGDWTQFLSTESTFKFGEKLTYDTLFVPLDQLQYSVIQARPSGFLRSNNILSGVLIFGLALHLSRDNRRLWWGTIILCAMLVLAGARIAYLCYLLMVLLLLFRGNYKQRKNAINSIITIGGLLLIYYFFFPGLFLNYWTFDSVFYNIFIRINDVVSAFGTESMIRLVLENSFSDTPTADWDTGGDSLSSFTLLVKYIPYIIGSFIVLFPLYLKSIRRQRKETPQFIWVARLCLINFIFYPAAVLIFLDQFYWFAAGFALSPLILLLPSAYLTKLLNYNSNETLSNRLNN